MNIPSFALRFSRRSLALAKSLVTWETSLPEFKRKKAYDAVIPKHGKVVRMTLSSGLGLSFLGNLRRFLSDALGSSSSSSPSPGSGGEDYQQVVIDGGRCTVFAKSEKSWTQVAAEEEEVRSVAAS